MARLILVLVGLVLFSASCGGAGHRKVAGPPPEYELPDQPDAAAPPREAGSH